MQPLKLPVTHPIPWRAAVWPLFDSTKRTWAKSHQSSHINLVVNHFCDHLPKNTEPAVTVKRAELVTSTHWTFQTPNRQTVSWLTCDSYCSITGFRSLVGYMRCSQSAVARGRLEASGVIQFMKNLEKKWKERVDRRRLVDVKWISDG